MAITPQPGWIVNPQGNGVIRDPNATIGPGGVVVPAPANTNLVKDPSTGAFTLPPNAGGNPLGTNPPTVASLGVGGGGTVGTGASAGDPYTAINVGLASILHQLAIHGSAQSNTMAGQVAAGTGAATTVAAQPYNPQDSTSTNEQNYTGTLDSFAPALGSMQNQYTGFETGLTGLGTALKATQDAYKPVPLGAGDSLVTPGGTVVIKGVTYNVQPDPLNPGHFISTPATSITPVGAGGGAAGGSTGGGSSNPAANALDAYNGGADPQYSSKVLGIQKTINAISPTPTADSLNTYIATYGKAPINGTMIMQVAQQYGLDPSLMAAQLALESHFGMIGESPNNNNPGGLKWANQPGAVQGEAVTDGTGGHYAKFKSPLDGLYAMGALMQQKNQQVASAGTSTGSGTSTSTTGPIADPQGNVFSPAYAARAQKVIAAAPILAPYITAGPGGVAYIAGDKATAGAPGLGNVAHLPAVQATGMPVDTDGGLGQQLDGLNTIAQQQQTMKTLIETSLNTGGGNSIWSHAINSVRADFNSLAQNDQAMTALTAYTSSVLAAAAEIKNLVGGAGSGVRITGFEITNQQAQMPQASDSYQQALTKLDAMNLRLAQALHTVFPDYDVSKAPLPQSQTPGQFTYGSSGSSDTTAAPGLSATSAAILAKYGIQ